MADRVERAYVDECDVLAGSARSAPMSPPIDPAPTAQVFMIPEIA